MLLDPSAQALFSQTTICQGYRERIQSSLELFEVPRIRRQTPVLPQRSASTDLLFVEPDDDLEDTAGTFIYKPDSPRNATSEADPEAHAATPASASTIVCSTSPSSANSDSEDSSDE